LVVIDQSYEKVLVGFEKALRDIFAFTEVPFATVIQCGRADHHDLVGAKKYAQLMLDGRSNWEIGAQTI
jgi:S-ribosylhomocysteine lyase LuxS involved in autoinducer biosynthesis